MTYIKNLDGLRGISILFVIISHIGFANFIPGGFGVTIFFFISGYLITRLLLEEKFEFGNIDIRKFYLRRLVRLYPTLLLFIFFGSTFSIVANYHFNWNSLFSALFYFNNYYNLFHDSEINIQFLNIFKICWSLSIEEQFYILFPLLFFFNLNFIKSTVITVLFSCLIIRLYTFSVSDYEMASEYNYYLSQTRIDSIAYGCLYSILTFKTRVNLKTNAKNIFLLISIVLLLFSLFFRNDFFRCTFRYSVQGVALSLLFPFLLEKSNLFRLKILNYVGKISYPLYLMHWLGVHVATHFVPIYTWQWYVIMGSITISTTLVSYELLEKKLFYLRVRFRRVKNTITAPPL